MYLDGVQTVELRQINRQAQIRFNHSLKLDSIGIKGEVLEWVKKWLSSRTQKVTIRNESSEWNQVNSGVPQGSVLGPILFLVYINDLEKGLISKINKFADDTKLARAVGNKEEIKDLQNDLSKIVTWSEEWQMQFNVNKCSVIHLGHSKFNK